MAHLSRSLLERQTDTHELKIADDVAHANATRISFRGLVLLTCFILSIAIWIGVTAFIIRI